MNNLKIELEMHALDAEILAMQVENIDLSQRPSGGVPIGPEVFCAMAAKYRKLKEEVE